MKAITAVAFVVVSASLAVCTAVESVPLFTEDGFKIGEKAVKIPEQNKIDEEHSKFAYVTLLCDPADAQGADYIRMLLVLKESIRQFDEENDIVTLIHGEITEDQWDLLEKEGFKFSLANEVGMMVSDPEPLRVPYGVSACYRSKLNILKLHQYQKVIFIDSHAIVKKDPRFLFETTGFVSYGGYETPFDGGLFAVEPSDESYSNIEQVFLSDSFHPQTGWMNYGSFPHWRLDGHESDWSFWCAHTDIGVLYFYYNLVTKTATILPRVEGSTIVSHFSGWKKPQLHDSAYEDDSPKKFMGEESMQEWYGLWDRVQARVDNKELLEPFMKRHPIESARDHTVAKIKRVLDEDIYGLPTSAPTDMPTPAPSTSAPTDMPTPAPLALDITAMQLVNITSGEVIKDPIVDGQTIGLQFGTESDLTVRAVSDGLDGKSVQFGLNDDASYKVDSRKEYDLNKNSAVPEMAGPGVFTVTATMYEFTKANEDGLSGAPYTITFELFSTDPTEPPSMSPSMTPAPTTYEPTGPPTLVPTEKPTTFKLNLKVLSLINPVTGAVIKSPLAFGETIPVVTGTPLTVRAEDDGLDGQSVKFFLGVDKYNRDSKPEYTMTKEGKGVDEFVGGGDFTISAEMYEKKQADGEVGKLLSVSFTIVEVDPTDSPTPAPTKSVPPTMSLVPSAPPTEPPTLGPTECFPKDQVTIFLYDADTDTAIEKLEVVQQIGSVDLCETGDTNLTIVAEPKCSGEFFASMKFKLTGGPKKVKNKEFLEPYSLGGDNDEDPSMIDYLAVDQLKVGGDYKLTVNPNPGAKQKFEFSVSECG